MPPKDEAALQGRALTKEEFDRLLDMASKFTSDGEVWPAAFNALDAYARWLHLQVDPSATFDKPAPAPTPIPSAYVQTLQPIPGAFARVLGAAGIAALTALATLAGVAGGGLLLLHHLAR